MSAVIYQLPKRNANTLVKDKATKRVFFGTHSKMNGLSRDIKNLKEGKQFNKL